MQDTSFTHILTPRLRIRRFQLKDAENLVAYRQDPEIARYQGWEGCTLDEAHAFIQVMQDAAPGTPGQWFQFAWALRETNTLIGDCGLRCTKSDPAQVELGFTLARAYQGQGYAHEAVSAVLGYGYETLALHRVFAITDERNISAQGLLHRLGFRQEGRFVEAAWFKGAWATELLYALLRTEWEAQYTL